MSWRYDVEDQEEDMVPPSTRHLHSLTPELIPVEPLAVAELKSIRVSVLSQPPLPLTPIRALERVTSEAYLKHVIPVYTVREPQEWTSDKGNDADDESGQSDEWVCPLDRDNYTKARIKDYANKAARDKVQRWIEAVLDHDFGGLELGPALQDGVALCEFLNKIRPGTVKKIHEVHPEEDAAFVSAANIFKAQENVSAFTKGCIKLGVPRSSLFDTLDIIELRNLNSFLNCATMLGRIVSTFKDYTGPQLLSKEEQMEALKLYFHVSKTKSLKNVPTMFSQPQRFHTAAAA
jgi:hypothetical protein